MTATKYFVFYFFVLLLMIRTKLILYTFHICLVFWDITII